VRVIQPEVGTRTRRVVNAASALIAGAGTALPLPTLMAGLAKELPWVPSEILTAELATAAAAGLITVTGSLVDAPAAHQEPVVLEDNTGPDADRPLRAVVIDVESVVRLAPDVTGFQETRIWQIGAVRLSADTEWETAQPRFARYCSLSSEWFNELRSTEARTAVATHGEPPAAVLSALREFCGDADALVAYNGAAVDFPLLADASARENLPEPSGLHIDAYYLALALWPYPPRSHRLAELAADVGVDTDGLRWHDASDDAELTVRLLRRTAAQWASVPAETRDILAAVTFNSMSWRLIRELNGEPPAPAASYDDQAVAAALTTAFAGLPMRRPPPGTNRHREPLTVPQTVYRADRISPATLAAVVTGGHVEQRPAQEEMADLLRKWLPHRDGAVEAPTGTGKSLALLAVALQWLATDTAHRVVIATHTKQLQAQMAADVAALDAAVPGLLDNTDVVKGAANRISLRALVTALSDTAAAAVGPHIRRGSHRLVPFAAETQYAELLTLLVLRLHYAQTRLQQWSACSLDAADLPAFLNDYLPARYPAYLASLSQTNGEYEPATVLAALTDTVTDAITGHRLILANHALLLSHLTDFQPAGGDTLLLIDEAHHLEAAATDSLTAVVHLTEIEQCLHAATTWLGRHGRHGPNAARAADAVEALRMLCDAEQLPTAIGQLLDQRCSRPVGTAGPGRAATLASPFPQDHGEEKARAITLLLSRAAGVIADTAAALWAHLAEPSTARADWHTRERTRQLATRLTALGNSARRIVDDATSILGPVTPGMARTGRVTAARPVAPVAADSGTRWLTVTFRPTPRTWRPAVWRCQPQRRTAWTPNRGTTPCPRPQRS
jgi:DNA polymerase III epsilon subunit-like protein